MQNVLRILFWLALVFAVTMAALPHPPDLPVPGNDKAQHMLAFATLAVLAVLAYPRVHKGWVAAGLVIVGAGIEIVQMIPALHRDADVMDLLADSLAIGVMLVLAALFPGLRKAR
ncbi:VanZ family protein [Novosphingobium gossypii]|uniref:hypothetical protein n=1 Tax=Novosphingobium gossypii TaxID=1604774 RepID=UPI003D1F696D